MDNTDRGDKPDQADSDPRPAAVTFVTTEHFTLAGARSSTISESTGRASVYLGAVSGGLVASGSSPPPPRPARRSTCSGSFSCPRWPSRGWRRSTGCCSQGSRTLDMRAASRGSAAITSITLPRWPATCPARRNRCPPRGLGIRLWQQFLTVAGMVAVITAVLSGSAGGLLAAVVSGHSLAAALAAGVVVAAAALTGLMRHQNSAWIRGSTASLFPGAEAGPH